MRCFRRLSDIKALTFDLDDTLYDNRPVIEHLEVGFRQWFAEHYPISTQRDGRWWLKIKRAVVETNPELKHDVTLWRHAQLKSGLERLGMESLQAKAAADEAIGEVLRLRNQIRIPEKTHQVLSALAKSFPLIAISNGNADPEKIGLGHYFQLALRAGPDGRAKPWPDMFVTAQRHLQLSPESILHVGDHGRTDVQGAVEFGMQACWMNDQQDTAISRPHLKVLPTIEIASLDELLFLV